MSSPTESRDADGLRSPRPGRPSMRIAIALALSLAAVAAVILASSSDRHRGAEHRRTAVAEVPTAHAARVSRAGTGTTAHPAHTDRPAHAAPAVHAGAAGGAKAASATEHAAGGSAGASATGDSGVGHAVARAASVSNNRFGPRDPEEAASFPVPATVHHATAATPTAAGRLTTAPDAPSNSEVEAELASIEAAEHASEQSATTPEAGGDSIAGDGQLAIPADLPEAVQKVIAGGNAIADFPYRYGGGHGSFVDDAYDCSGSVSYALAAAGLLDRTMVSGELAHWGDPGPGRYITIYANAGHVFMDVAGFWFDTAGRSGPYSSRWLVPTARPSLAGYAVRHPVGY